VQGIVGSSRGKPEVENSGGQRGGVIPPVVVRAYTPPGEFGEVVELSPGALGRIHTPAPVETVETVEVSAPAAGGEGSS
jgi:hypothetical protein